MDVSPICFDLETAGLPNAEDFLEPVQPARNLKDPDKIKADIEQKTAERLDRIALDWNVGRIVVLAWWTQERGEVVLLCKDEQEEIRAIGQFWHEAKHRLLVGFAIKQFDLRFLIQRSRYLGVSYPVLDLGKYSKQGIRDLYLELTFGDGTYDQGAMRRTLKQFCRRFSIPVVDEIDGKDVPALIAAGKWEEAVAHAKADIALTVALAQRLGVIQAPAGVL